jgi:hypothetical protein
LKKNVHVRLAAMLLVYLLLKFMGGTFGRLALYPVTLLVTFLHEFGHALGAIITGGIVHGLQVNPDGSGYTVTRGGSPGLILMGGYLGSVVLGNVLLHIGVRYHRLTQLTLVVLAVLMALAGLVWFESFISTAILLGFAALLAFLALRTSWDQDMLLFLGLAAVLYVLEDFNQGPQSDLAMYEQTVGIFPAKVWMYLWLFLALVLTFLNLRRLLRRVFAR